MINARNGKITDIGISNPLNRNIDGDTVAILLSSKGIIPPRQWMHDVNLRNHIGETIKSYLYQ